MPDLYNYLTWGICEHIKLEEIFIAGPEELSDIDFFKSSYNRTL